MGVEVKPLGVKCNIQCQYCYQNPTRDAGNLPRSYDLKKIKAAIRAEGGPFSLFGGEPLLMPKEDLEDLWSWGLENYGRNSLQTNGTLIDSDHVRMFKQYKVNVGLSLDGPGDLNDARWNGTLERTRDATARAERAIDLLCREGIRPSIIVTLHQKNAAPGKRPFLYDWIRYLDGIGVRRVRLHVLEHDNLAARLRYELSMADNRIVLCDLLELEKSLHRLRFDLFADMRKLLRGRDQRVTCVWKACDPYTTRAVSGIEGDGQRSNCGRINKDGIEYVKAQGEGFERYVALYRTAQEAGGCQGCRFFLMCKGQCPGTAMQGDYRNRSEYCELWKSLFEELESEAVASGVMPLSLSTQRTHIEHEFVRAWAQGQNPALFHYPYA